MRYATTAKNPDMRGREILRVYTCLVLLFTRMDVALQFPLEKIPRSTAVCSFPYLLVLVRILLPKKTTGRTTVHWTQAGAVLLMLQRGKILYRENHENAPLTWLRWAMDVGRGEFDVL